MQKKLIVFIDSGDTIIDEGTEERDERGIVYHAEMIEGAGETLKELYDQGYTIALVADGEWESFENIYNENGLGYCFTTRAVSEIVGKQKPAQIMFQAALVQLKLADEDKKRIVMIGNNIKKDIVGANRFGITSILLNWSPRYPMTPETEEEQPDYTISTPRELLPLLDKLNKELE